jgi:hypothetical protein
VSSDPLVVELGVGWLVPEWERESSERRGECALTGAGEPEAMASAQWPVSIGQWVVGLEIGSLVLELEGEGMSGGVSMPLRE